MSQPTPPHGSAPPPGGGGSSPQPDGTGPQDADPSHGTTVPSDAAHGAPSSASPYVRHTSDAYGTPGADGAYGGRAPRQPGSPALGWVAAAAGLIALLGSAGNGIACFFLLGPEVLDAAVEGDDVTVFAALGLAQLLVLWFAFGLWAVVQGIVAIATKRGVGPGVAGLVLGLVGPWIGTTLAAVAIGRIALEYST